MKLTKFYLLFEGDLQPMLYAMSNDKDMVKLFKKTRNMEKFYVKEQDISKKDYESILRDHHMLMLRNIWLKSRVNGNTSVVNIPGTSIEEQEVMRKLDTVCDIILPDNIDDFTNIISKLNKKTINLLNSIGLFNILKFYHMMNSINRFGFEMDYSPDEFDELMYNEELLKNWGIDELNVFIAIYSGIVKSKGVS